MEGGRFTNRGEGTNWDLPMGEMPMRGGSENGGMPMGPIGAGLQTGPGPTVTHSDPQ